MQLARAVELVDMFMGHVGYTRFPSNMVTQGHFEDKVGAITPHGGIVVLVDDGASPYHSIQPRLGALHKTFVVSDAIRQRRTLITNTLIGDRFQRSLRGTLLERCYRCSAEGGGSEAAPIRFDPISGRSNQPCLVCRGIADQQRQTTVGVLPEGGARAIRRVSKHLLEGALVKCVSPQTTTPSVGFLVYEIEQGAPLVVVDGQAPDVVMFAATESEVLVGRGAVGWDTNILQR